jgi:hypothetical protein
MRISALKYTVLTWVSALVMLIIFLIPFQGFLTVWAAHLIGGHYTAVRLWDEVLLLLCVIGTLYLLLTDHKIRFNTLSRRLVQLIFLYIFLNVAWGLIEYHDHVVTLKALGYGLIVNLRYLVFFLVTWSVALRISRLHNHWQKLIIWPAILVIIIGLLEIFILPRGFLSHFGYSKSTIPAIETINNNSSYQRFPSTLRGANPLGAYLIIPISVMTVLVTRNKKNWQRAFFLLGCVILLFWTFSRSAWLGAILSMVIIYLTGKLNQKYQKIAIYSGVSLVVIFIGLLIAFHNTPRFQNFVLHTQSHSLSKNSSDGDHLSSLESGIKQVIHEPFGRGPGTAGPASVYNNGKTRIAEDYFLQIGQEVGWLGLLIYIMITIGIGYLLWLRRDEPLALSLFASFIGITLVNLFLYAWSDDTLAYIWWGLAGIAMAPEIKLKLSSDVEPKPEPKVTKKLTKA